MESAVLCEIELLGGSLLTKANGSRRGHVLSSILVFAVGGRKWELDCYVESANRSCNSKSTRQGSPSTTHTLCCFNIQRKQHDVGLSFVGGTPFRLVLKDTNLQPPFSWVP